jgi:HAE1 family hydrophobic/amphiphilic exporter-1
VSPVLNISAIFIRRPVMTTLVMLAIVLFGVIGFRQLPINSLPKVDFPTVLVQASLPGASPETMATTVATVLERQFSTIPGVDSMNSTSSTGSTQIILQFNLNRNVDAASQDVETAISAAISLLPPMPSRPFFRKLNPADFPVFYLQVRSETLPMSRVDEYAENLIAQRLSMVDGVAQVQVYGSQKYAVRVQMNPNRLSSAGIGVDEVASAVANGTVKLPTGSFNGKNTFYNLQTNDQLLNAKAFRKLVVATRHGALIHLEDVADVLDSVENDKVQNWTMHGSAVVLAIQRQPDTNTVAVIDGIRATLPALQAALPRSVDMAVLFDGSVSIRASVHDVEFTLLITAALVVMVIFFFLRDLRATIIPSLSLPTSLLGTFAVMALLDFSLDDLSLMALTLSVGFVVDDAIVVLENIMRHLEMGEERHHAAMEGTREVSFTIVSMTLSLVAVFIPILFMSGLIGKIFWEFAVTITVAILISGFVSLTLTPMLCSKFLRPPSQEHGRGHRMLEWGFGTALGLYDSLLKVVLRFRLLVLIGSVLLIFVTGWLVVICPKGLIPTQDGGQLMGNTEAVQDISFQSMRSHQAEISNILRHDPNVQDFMSSVGVGGNGGTLNAGHMFITLRERSQRKLSADQIMQELRKKASQIPGISLYLQNPSALHIGGQSTKGQYQLTLLGTNLQLMYKGVDLMLAQLRKIPEIQDPTPDVQPTSLQANLVVDRDKAASYGISTHTVDDALSNAYGTKQAAMIYTSDNEYKVLLEVQPKFYSGPHMLDQLYLHGTGSSLVPLSTVAKVRMGTGPLSVTHLGQMPSATLSFNLSPGISLSQVIPKVEDAARRVLPNGVTASFQGNAGAFKSAVTDMIFLIIIAILFIYIVLGILYESFVHPLTILMGLPSAAMGAVLTLIIFHSELDVYSFLGLIMLIGIVKKNAIMIIDHALEIERTRAVPPALAIHEACLVRFRPIMMTTVASLMGALPMATGLGAGGEARQPLGLAVAGGLLVSQLLTLFITPVIYIYFDQWQTRLFGRGPARDSHAHKLLSGS